MSSVNLDAEVAAMERVRSSGAPLPPERVRLTLQGTL
jgi:hypothetical protein